MTAVGSNLHSWNGGSPTQEAVATSEKFRIALPSGFVIPIIWKTCLLYTSQDRDLDHRKFVLIYLIIAAFQLCTEQVDARIFPIDVYKRQFLYSDIDFILNSLNSLPLIIFVTSREPI